MSLRNIAIIAHVDHGKTTLLDALLKQSWSLKSSEEKKCVMDSNDQERERWITIYAKNTSVIYKWSIINIIDTPWHADFGSEVERVLRMVDSVLLIVDAYEWPMPQTKFVLKKSLDLWLKPIVVINKIDKPTARPDEVVDMVFELFVKLWATNEQLDFPIIYAIAKEWIAMNDIYDEIENKDISPLFDAIIKHVLPAQDYSDKPFRMQVANLDYSDFFGRLWIWRVYEWTIKKGQSVAIIWNDWKKRLWKISKIFITRWLNKIEVDKWDCWDIITIAWIPDIYVWETVWVWEVSALPWITIDEPTMVMEFLVNDSPFAWREWKYVTSRNLKERLEKELEMNVWLKVEFADKYKFIVSWRWELHLSVLIESMRREWFELQVSAPQVIFRHEWWNKLEPIELLIINVDENIAWSIIEAVSNRKWILKDMSNKNWLTTIEFDIPTRWLLWFRSWFIMQTKWEWIMYSSFSHYADYKWDIPKREVWSMISWETWKVMKYSIYKLQERWPIFVQPATDIYEGMIVWEHLKWWDLVVNLLKNKQLTNVRESWNDEAMRLEPIRTLSLEDALSYIWTDEYVEITPKSIRLRKKYLTESARKNASKNK